eukprot:COSAG06_NODE_4916_length_3861_cov_66.663477_3_plen_91_part_00
MRGLRWRARRWGTGLRGEHAESTVLAREMADRDESWAAFSRGMATCTHSAQKKDEKVPYLPLESLFLRGDPWGVPLPPHPTKAAWLGIFK